MVYVVICYCVDGIFFCGFNGVFLGVYGGILFLGVICKYFIGVGVCWV